MAVVGIDLGTTNTVVACARGGQVQVLADEQGRRLLPSVVSFLPNGEVVVGHPAKERLAIDAKNTIASAKRLIGRSWDSKEMVRARQRFPFEVKEGPREGPLVVARGHDYTLAEISAFVLRRARQIAERALGEPVERAVVTVPASFNELQRTATKVAGQVAGLEVVRIINEPTAAALAYGLGRGSHERIAVYDFGGGTFDCTLLALSDNVFEVLATAGDSYLGGDDIDLAVAERMADAFLKAHRYDPRANPQAFERLRGAAEAIKMDLSLVERSHTRLKEVAFGVGGAHLDLDFDMTRSELEALATPLVERTFAVCQEALAVAQLPVSAFDKIVLVGGSTRIPLVRRRVEQFFGRPPLDRVNPDEVVAIGAAIQAAALTEVAQGRSIPPPPVPGGPGGPRPSMRPLLPGLPPPPSASRTSSRPPRAMGDLHGARPPVLADVTPWALAVETVGGWCDVVVQRNAKIPCERTRAFTTSSDMQSAVNVRVAQGEDPLFGNNTYLGEVELVGLRAARRGEVTIQVRFEVDESGTLKVFATDTATGHEAHALLQLVAVSGEQSIEKMQARQAALKIH